MSISLKHFSILIIRNRLLFYFLDIELCVLLPAEGSEAGNSGGGSEGEEEEEEEQVEIVRVLHAVI